MTFVVTTFNIRGTYGILSIMTICKMGLFTTLVKTTFRITEFSILGLIVTISITILSMTTFGIIDLFSLLSIIQKLN
jgi:hypothetical protein